MDLDQNKLGVAMARKGRIARLQWVQAKLNAAWDKDQDKLAPYRADSGSGSEKWVGVVALAVSPAGADHGCRAAVYGVVQAVLDHSATGAAIGAAGARLSAAQTLIPALLGAAKPGNAVNGVAKQISDGVSRFANSVGSLVGLAAGAACRFW